MNTNVIKCDNIQVVNIDCTVVIIMDNTSGPIMQTIIAFGGTYVVIKGTISSTAPN